MFLFKLLAGFQMQNWQNKPLVSVSIAYMCHLTATDSNTTTNPAEATLNKTQAKIKGNTGT